MDTTIFTLSFLSPSTIPHLRQLHAHIIKTPQQNHHLSIQLISSISVHHPDHLPYALSILPHLPSFNPHPFPHLLKATTQISSLSTGYTLHAFITKLGFVSNPHILTALLTLYSSLGESHSAHKLFDKCPDRNKCKIATWNSLISGLVKSRDSHGAIGLFNRLLKERRVEPDEITVVSVLTACADIGALDATRWIHEHAMRSKVAVNVYVGTALVDAYAKCGCIVMARKVFGEMRERNVRSWTAMIRGLAMFGHGDEAVSLFEEMVNEGFRPDSVTFTAVLSACCHSGLVDKGRSVFSNMVVVFRIVPRMEHYGCMVDMFSRAGLLNEALGLIKSMPVKADAALWGSLLSACRRNPSNVELAEYAASHLIEIEPDNESNYVLLSNIYAFHNRWEDVGRLRTQMKARGIAKPPGCSSVELHGEVHEFVVGDKSHPRIDQISAMVKEIDSRVGELGHVVHTSEVLLDIEEEEKKKALLLHSEKLALAFGLIATEHPTSIRIVNNLRVCNDCHSVMKLASKAFGREIILRDRNRFHTFREGSCTCGDFW